MKKFGLKRKRSRIGILGGVFDPIHIGHLLLAQRAKESFSLGQVIFVPAGRPPHRALPSASDKDRLEMVRLAVQDESDFVVSDIEIKDSRVKFTYDTLDYFSKLHPEWEIFLIIGVDNAKSFDSWKNWRGILKRWHVIAGLRPGLKVVKNISYGKRGIKLFSMPLIGTSSSEIRKRINKGFSCRWLLSPQVEEYIHAKNLYR